MGLTLADGAWRSREGLAQLADTLGAREGLTRLVGGVVRDTLLGIDAADIDLATRLTPDAVIDRLDAARIRAVPTGIAHGTITAVLASGPVEVTTLRRDVATDGRHAVVAFSDDWREDAGRRDFTINALYADPAGGAIFDYFSGLDDLAARRVRFIGDPLQRIAEDHLRILRFFRFHARFGDAIDTDGLGACIARANDLMALSRERIAGELLRLLVAPAAVPVMALMVTHGILRAVLPEIDDHGIGRFAALADREAAATVPPDAIRRLSALLPRNPEIGDAVGARLRLSKLQCRRLICALRDRTGSPYEDAYRWGREEAIDRMLLAIDKPMDAVLGAHHLSTWDIPRFPLSGGALVARGLSKGPEVAAALRTIETQWIAEHFPDARRVDQIADALVAAALARAKAKAASASSGRE